jgi:uncharacterized membrane protein YkvA (DUF1232 family)
MAIRISSRLARPWSLPALVAQARLAVRLVREPRVPFVLKGIPLLAGLYVISPIDFVPDFIPGLGQLDDLGIMLAALELFVRACPQSAQDFHREAIARRRRYSPMTPADAVIEAEWHHS